MVGPQSGGSEGVRDWWRRQRERERERGYGLADVLAVVVVGLSGMRSDRASALASTAAALAAAFDTTHIV